MSNSVSIHMEDVHFIVGPNTNHMSKDEDYKNVNSDYDCHNPMTNIIRMMKQVQQEYDDEKATEDAEKEAAEAEAKEKDKTPEGKEEAKKEKDKAADPSAFSAPKGLGYVFNLVKGVKLHIHRVHIRYEDDFFNNHRPFSMGILLEAIDLDCKDTHWEFETPNGMRFKRQKN